MGDGRTSDRDRAEQPGSTSGRWHPQAHRLRREHHRRRGIPGSTFDGSYEPVEEISSALDELASRGGPDVPLHVSGASGAMVAPFLDPDLLWDFRLARVDSINTSGHKYGLVYPGVGPIRQQA